MRGDGLVVSLSGGCHFCHKQVKQGKTVAKWGLVEDQRRVYHPTS